MSGGDNCHVLKRNRITEQLRLEAAPGSLLIQNPCSKQGQLQQALNIPMPRDFTPSLGNLLHCLIILTVENTYLQM